MKSPTTLRESEPITFKKRSKKTGFARKRTPPPATHASDSDYTASEDDEGHKIKRRRREGGLVTKSNLPIHRTVEENLVPITSVTARQPDEATKTADWFDERERDAAHHPKPAQVEESVNPSKATDGYKGLQQYQSFIQKNPNALSRQVGPVKGSSNVRTITVTDFAPDVCKDYKQTGFCGFGDSCKFLHAREDYKQGWQLDRDWEIGGNSKKSRGTTVASADRSLANGNGDLDDDALLEKIPFACVICKDSYKNPIVTKCGHYFCEACALQKYRKSPSCAACGTGTGGVFNVAKKLTKLLERKKERMEKKAQNDEDDTSEKQFR